QFPWSDRLGEEIAGPQAQGPDGQLDRRVSREQQNPRGWPGQVKRIHLLDELQAIQVRHADVADDDRDVATRADLDQGLRRLAERDASETGFAQNVVQERQSCWVVVQQKN